MRLKKHNSRKRWCIEMWAQGWLYQLRDSGVPLIKMMGASLALRLGHCTANVEKKERASISQTLIQCHLCHSSRTWSPGPPAAGQAHLSTSIVYFTLHTYTLQAHTEIRKHTDTQRHKERNIHTRTLIHRHIQTHIHTETHTHTYTQTHKQVLTHEPRRKNRLGAEVIL